MASPLTESPHTSKLLTVYCDWPGPQKLSEGDPLRSDPWRFGRSSSVPVLYNGDPLGHHEMCEGECGPCGGVGGVPDTGPNGEMAMLCLTCGGSGRCHGCVRAASSFSDAQATEGLRSMNPASTPPNQPKGSGKAA